MKQYKRYPTLKYNMTSETIQELKYFIQVPSVVFSSMPNFSVIVEHLDEFGGYENLLLTKMLIYANYHERNMSEMITLALSIPCQLSQDNLKFIFEKAINTWTPNIWEDLRIRNNIQFIMDIMYLTYPYSNYETTKSWFLMCNSFVNSPDQKFVILSRLIRVEDKEIEREICRIYENFPNFILSEPLFRTEK